MHLRVRRELVDVPARAESVRHRRRGGRIGRHLRAVRVHQMQPVRRLAIQNGAIEGQRKRAFGERRRARDIRTRSDREFDAGDRH